MKAVPLRNSFFLCNFVIIYNVVNNRGKGKAHGRIKFSSHYFINCIRFLAAFIDSVVGGGGLISLPALMFVGLSPASAIATNKLAATMGTFTSAMYFIRSGKVDFKIVGKVNPVNYCWSCCRRFSSKIYSIGYFTPISTCNVGIYCYLYYCKKNWEVCLPIRR